MLALLGLAIPLSYTNAICEVTDAIPLHSIEVSLSPSELTAKVTNEQLGSVTFGGNVTIEKPPGVERATVTLQGTCGRGFPTVTSPQSIPFIDPGTERFTVTVIVPPDTAPISTTVRVDAWVDSPIWEDTASCEATVSVAQFFKFETWIEGEVEEVTPGGSVGGTLSIFNNGTGQDRFLISIQSQPDFVSRVDIEDSVTIPRKSEVEVQFILTISDDKDLLEGGEAYAIVFRVESEGARNLDLLLVDSTQFYVFAPTLAQRLEEDWPTYVGFGASAAVVATLAFLVVRRRRRGKAVTREGIEG